MASTWSALQIELLETGANSGTWGTATNVNLGDAVLGEAITGSATVNFPSAADVTITLTNAATTQSARNLRLNITESGAGIGYAGNLILGSNCQIEKFYLIRNNGTGVKTIKNTSGTGVAVAAGKATLVYNDGTNVVDVLNSFSSAILGAENAGSIIPFYFANQAAFPTASTYHGAIAHSHADGAMYFAHSGSWVRMLDAGTTVTPAQGGTGVANNAASTITVSGAFGTTLTVSGTTGVTLPTTGTLSTLAGTETLINKTLTSPTLTTPALGTPASGVLSSCTVDGTNAVGFKNIPLSGSPKTTSYTLTTGDIGKLIQVNTGGSIVVPDATFATGDAVVIFNGTGSSITLTMSITTAYIGGTAVDVATITLAPVGVCNILFVSSVACVVTGNVT